MSTYSNAWMRQTSLPGIGTILLATLYGGLICFPVDGSGDPPLADAVVIAPVVPAAVEKSGRTPPVADEAGKSEILARERGRGVVVVELAVV